MCFLLLSFSSAGCSLFGSSTTDETPEDPSNPKRTSAEEDDDGYGTDFDEMELFAEGMRSYDAERYSISRSMFDKLVRKFPGSPLTVLAELKIADSSFYAEKYQEAVPFYQDFARINTTHPARPYVLYQIAQSYLATYQGLKQDETPLKEAKNAYNRVVTEYPKSIWADYAKDQIKECDLTLLKSELEVIKFYQKTGQNTAAKARLNTAKTSFAHLDESSSLISELMEETIHRDDSETIGDDPSLLIQTSELNHPIPESNYMKIAKTERKTEEKSEKQDFKDNQTSPELNELNEENKSMQAEAIIDQNINNSQSLKVTHEAEFKPQETLLPATVKTISSRIEKDQGRTLESLERSSLKENLHNQNRLKATEDEKVINKSSLENITPPQEVQDEKNSIFLKNVQCESNEEMTRLVLYFNSKPYLRSSSDSNLEPGSNEYPLNFESRLIIQNAFSIVPIELADQGNSNSAKWIPVKLEHCGSSLDRIQIQEFAKIQEDDDELPNAVVRVILNSAKNRLIKALNFSDPERLVLTYR